MDCGAKARIVAVRKDHPRTLWTSNLIARANVGRTGFSGPSVVMVEPSRWRGLRASGHGLVRGQLSGSAVGIEEQSGGGADIFTTQGTFIC